MSEVLVTGVVGRVFFDGKGASVEERYKSKSGDDRVQRWSVWFQTAHGLSVGDRVHVRGLLSAKVDEFTNAQGELKRFVALSINNAHADLDSGAARTVSEKVAEWAAAPAPVFVDDGDAPF